jgi:hypothetical protein
LARVADQVAAHSELAFKMQFKSRAQFNILQANGGNKVHQQLNHLRTNFGGQHHARNQKVAEFPFKKTFSFFSFWLTFGLEYFLQ